MVRQYQRHHAAETRLGEGGNRAWIDPMFVKRIRTDLEFDAGPGELSQLSRQIVRSLQAGDCRAVNDDTQSCLRPLLRQISQVGEDVWPVLNFGGVQDNVEVCRDSGGGGNGWRR